MSDNNKKESAFGSFDWAKDIVYPSGGTIARHYPERTDPMYTSIDTMAATLRQQLDELNTRTRRMWTRLDVLLSDMQDALDALKGKGKAAA